MSRSKRRLRSAISSFGATRRRRRGKALRVTLTPPSLDAALDARSALFDAPHAGAYRLFNGFAEGDPGLTLDVYGRTLLVHDHGEVTEASRARVDAVVEAARARLPWLRAAVWKARRAEGPEGRNGVVVFGADADLDRKVREHGVWYALSLMMNRDAGLYLDTRELRAWALANLSERRVLNTFAYTGSLGVAAKAGGARAVVQLDRNPTFLEVARRSSELNGFAVAKRHLVAGDYFTETSRLRREGALFDCVFVDPPFFSATNKGTVDLEEGAARVLDKARPLVGDGGWLVAVNNALWVSGADWLRVLTEGSGGYAELESTVPVPDDVRGMLPPTGAAPPADPAPFGHPTKIAVLRVRRKDGRKAT
jgi:23S rRNA (cytosine1962-C5)-methyltransferase